MKFLFGCLTCGVERAFVHVRRPFVQQTEGLRHVVGRSHGGASQSTRLLHETESVVRAHHLPADPPQTPAREEVTRSDTIVGCSTFPASY